MSILHMKDTFKKWQHLVARVYRQEGGGTPTDEAGTVESPQLLLVYVTVHLLFFVSTFSMEPVSQALTFGHNLLLQR